MTHQTCVKAEPILSEDQDLIMFYLNSDYMSTTSCWTNSQNHVSTPPTPRPTPTHGLSPISIPESQFHTKNNGVTPIIPKTLPDNDDWNNSTNSIEFFRQQEFNLSCVQPNIFTDFPFMANPQECEQPSPYIGSTDTVMYTPTMFVPHYLISQQPTSPSSLSSYSSSCSVTERPKKKRGRKKRDSTNNTAFTSNQSSSLKPGTPAMIAPAPPARQLATILPAYKPRNQPEYTNKITNCENIQLDTNVSLPHTSIKTETNSSQITSIADKTAAIDSQKAATIAKRQERLIKNRAAALLSRKRKREHLTALEDQRKDLSNANQALHQRVLELEKENFALKSKMKETNSTTSHSFERSSSEIISMVSRMKFEQERYV